MGRCEDCRFADWDYELYYGSNRKAWFVCGCIKDLDCEEDGASCEGYEENQNEAL